jgi:hypothetical protein
VLDLDSSLTARKALAHDLQYTGDTNDSASMNIWLHKQIMGKLSAHGGKCRLISRPELSQETG